jgi:hypothetical protein
MRKRVTCGGAVLLALALAAAAPAPSTNRPAITGQVVWAGGNFEPEKLKVDKDQDVCLKDGDLLSEKYVVDPKTKGVRWVMVWLIDPKNPRAPLPMTPEQKAAKPKKWELDQPTCRFEPHVLAIREGDELVVRNAAKIAHNVNVVGGVLGPNLNQIVPPGGRLEIGDFKAGTTPVNISCTIHGWMKGYVRVFSHPFFAVTDEKGNFEIKDPPAGKWNLVLWQEEKGWVTDGGKLGTPVTVEAGTTTKLGKIELKP